MKSSRSSSINVHNRTGMLQSAAPEIYDSAHDSYITQNSAGFGEIEKYEGKAEQGLA